MNSDFSLLALSRWFSSSQSLFAWLLLTGGLLTGCQTPSGVVLSPLHPELEPVVGSGARYLVLVNDSSQELHNCFYTVYLSDRNDPNPLLRLQPFARCSGCKPAWAPGEETRFRRSESPTFQFPIVQPLTHIEVIGHCDEGQFRQSWRLIDSDDGVRPVGVKAEFAPLPDEPAASTTVTYQVRPPGENAKFMSFPGEEALARVLNQP